MCVRTRLICEESGCVGGDVGSVITLMVGVVPVVPLSLATPFHPTTPTLRKVHSFSAMCSLVNDDECCA